MSAKSLARDLREIVGDRVTTSQFECWYYARDFTPVPGIVRSLFKTTPVAVVKPVAIQEIADILQYCARNRIPVVPRGSGSSGLFGAVPKKDGVVLDLTGLPRITDINQQEETVTAEAGTTLWELDRRLRRQGLTLRSYPASARSATIGGWIAGSGLGIGSLKYGPVCQHIVSAEVVLASGAVKEYTPGQGLKWFCETEGILGVLTRVRLRVRRTPELTRPHLLYFDDIKDLFEFINPLVNSAPCPYSVEICDGKYLALVEASGYRVTGFSPGGGSLLVTYEGESDQVEEGSSILKRLAPRFRGEEREGADDQWQQRFNMFRIRREIPGVVPAGVRVPLASLGRFYLGTEKLTKRPIGLLGHVISGGEYMLTPLTVSDEKKVAEYVLALHTPRELANLALSVGGKPSGGLGVWNAPYKKEMLSESRIEEIKQRKKELDPAGILNPGMWLDPPFLFAPGVYQVAMAIASRVDGIIPGRMPKPEARSLLKEVSACVQCGYCMNYCPTRQQWLSSTPRGRILMTKEVLRNRSLNRSKVTPEYVNSIYECSVCGRCKVDCGVDIRSTQMWFDLRSELFENGFELESLKPLTGDIVKTHNLVARPNAQRTDWARRLKLPLDLDKKKARVIYFVGCVTAFYPMVQDIARSFVRILDAAGVDFTILGGEEWCCGYPLLAAGHREDFEASMRHNTGRIKETGAEAIVVTCPGCYQMWHGEYYRLSGRKPPFEIIHSTQFIAGLIEKGEIKLNQMDAKLTYHDPCDLGRNSGVFDEPRRIISQVAGANFVELPDNREYCNCCGSGGNLLASKQELSLEIARRKVNEIVGVGAQTLVTACPSCVRAITMAKTMEKVPFDVQDITQFVWRSMVK